MHNTCSISALASCHDSQYPPLHDRSPCWFHSSPPTAFSPWRRRGRTADTAAAASCLFGGGGSGGSRGGAARLLSAAAAAAAPCFGRRRARRRDGAHHALLGVIDLGEDVHAREGEHAVILLYHQLAASRLAVPEAGRHRQHPVVEQGAEDEDAEADEREPGVRRPGGAEVLRYEVVDEEVHAPDHKGAAGVDKASDHGAHLLPDDHPGEVVEGNAQHVRGDEQLQHRGVREHVEALRRRLEVPVVAAWQGAH
mmetsp:Transcript_71158/g.180151  ORF Transcript_71158/g.180151 Transcript_71158/m.180151 type:complete len:253 (+) Transcript_71158:328-1086(+)